MRDSVVVARALSADPAGRREACEVPVRLAMAALMLAGGCSRVSLDQAAAVGSRQLAATGQAQCQVVKDPDKPLIVEWSGMDAAELEARMLRGVVAVRYEGCEMEVLRGCRIDGAYAFTEAVTRVDRVHMRSADDLYLELPLGAAPLSAHIDRGEALDLEIVVVGRYDAPQASYDRAALRGPDCGRATHVVSGVSLGAFRLSAEEARSRGAAAGGKRVQLGGHHARSARVLKESPPDRLEYCMAVDEPIAARRAVCGAPIRLEVAPVEGAEAVADARELLVPPRFEPSGAAMGATGSAEAHQLFEVAVALQDDDAVPPEHLAGAWCALAGIPEDNPYLAQAEALCGQWGAYTDRLRAEEASMRADYDELRKLLALAYVPVAYRRQAVRTFLSAHVLLAGDEYPEIRAAQRAARRLDDGKGATLPEREARPARVWSRLRR